MPVCVDERWDMELIVLDSTTSEHFTFDIEVDNEIISGWVTDEDGNRTPLSGSCRLISPSGRPEVSLMDFRFIAKAQNGDVEILMGGIGFDQSDPALRPIFRGNFIAVAPPNAVVEPSLLPVGIDEGDTGTGNGQQT